MDGLDRTERGDSGVNLQRKKFSNLFVFVALGLIAMLFSSVARPQIAMGASWTSVSIPSAPEASFGVSCRSTTFCIGVGSVNNGENPIRHPLAVVKKWNGAAWSNEFTETPSEARTSALVSVSCPSTGHCYAVGHFVDSSGTEATLAGLEAGEWLRQTTPNPAGAKASSLSGVSCTSAEACTAVGQSTNSAGTVVTLAERWNGKEWTLQTTPNPAGATNTLLSGVSCTSVEACTAVGKNGKNQAGESFSLVYG